MAILPYPSTISLLKIVRITTVAALPLLTACAAERPVEFDIAIHTSPQGERDVTFRCWGSTKANNDRVCAELQRAFDESQRRRDERTTPPHI